VAPLALLVNLCDNLASASHHLITCRDTAVTPLPRLGALLQW